MTIQQIITTVNILTLMGFITVIILSIRSTRKVSTFNMLHVEASRKQAELQAAIDRRHGLLYLLNNDQPVNESVWNDASADIAAKQLELDMSVVAMRKQLTKL